MKPDVTMAGSALVAPEMDSMDYDTHVRELAFEKRAQPKDRTKTEEELALVEKEALEKAERRRQRRMFGEDDWDSDEDDSKGNGRGKGKKRERKKGADDLDDDFHEEDWAGLSTGLSAKAPDDVEEPSTSEEDEEGDEDEESDEEKSEVDGDEGKVDDGSDEDSEAEEGEQTELSTVKPKKPASKTGKTRELPFTFSCPETHEEFLEIVNDVEDSDVPTVVKRIRALYHPSLAPENKLKLQVRSQMSRAMTYCCSLRNT